MAIADGSSVPTAVAPAIAADILVVLAHCCSSLVICAACRPANAKRA
jgi:hypothetical protein